MTLKPGDQVQNGIVANSDLSYEPPEQVDESAEGRELALSTIAEIEAEFNGDKAAKWLEENPPDPADEQDADPTPEPAPQEPADEDEPIDPKVSRTFERVVQRELAAKDAEAKANARIAEADARMAQYKSLEGLKTTQELSKQMEYDPYSAIKAMGHNPADIIRLALAKEVLEKPVPTDPAHLQSYNELKDFAKGYEHKREIAELRAQVAKQEYTRRADEYVNSIRQGAREYVSKVGESTPTLARLHKANPDKAHDEIFNEIVADAKVRSAADPNAEPMSYEQAAKNVESRLSEWAKYLVPSTTTGTTNAKPTTPPQQKPPTRPLKPWESSKEDIYDKGIKEALRAYHQHEAANKRR